MSNRPVDVGLKREMGLIGAMWASETSIIGSGWLFGSFFAATYLGPSAIWAWVVGGVAVIILALVHAELGGMFPVAGGTARFPHLAFGSGAGISFGFFSWLQAVTVAPIECYAVIRYGQYWLDSAKINVLDPTTGNATHLGFVVVIVLMAIMTGVNFFAMRLFNFINAGITWWKVAIPVLAIIVLFFKFHPHNFSVQGGLNPGHAFGGPGPQGTGWHDFFYAIPGASIVFAYLGFEQADQLAGEVKDPQKNLPRAIIGAILLGTTIYVLLQVVFIGATPSNLISGHLGFAGISSTSPIAIGPFAGLAGVAGLAWLAAVLRLDAFVSPYGTGQVYVTSTSRVGYGLARNRYYPSMFTKTDAKGVPWFSLVVSFLFGLVFLLPFPSWHSLVGLVTSASVLMYAGAPLAMGAFRKNLPDAVRPYKMPAAAVIAPIAFIVANLIIYWSGFEVLWKLGVAIIIGYLLILMHFSDNPHAPKVDWARSAWLGVYLLGMGIISWMGQFGPENTQRIPFWWDMGIVAVFSLVIYYWAIGSAQSRTDMERAISAQGGGSEDWEAQVAEAEGAAETPAT
ncbi:MAG TPA: APC family permease [Streptosporangiaceae bacterium]|nr:APC family permease [Streptosporangiaceae bacterium]